jgi:hypothetical protein
MRWATGSALLFLAASLPAFPEALVFDKIDAVADLRDDGRLDVRETHTISVDEEVQDFTWDVGIAAGQRFELQRLVRVLDDGSERELSQGEPTQTESFYLGRAWLRIGLKPVGEKIAGQKRAYRIEYTLHGALAPAWDLPAGPQPLDATRSEYWNPIERLGQVRAAWQDASPRIERHYRIDHDVLFPSRTGPGYTMREFVYNLNWDKRTYRILHPEREAGVVTKDAGGKPFDYRVQRLFEYLPSGKPAVVDERGAQARLLAFLALPVLGGVLWLLFLAWETLRFARRPKAVPAFFEELAREHPAEAIRYVAGGRTRRPAFRDVVETLVREKKLSVRVLRPATEEESADVELRLVAEREALRPHEQKILDAIIGTGARDTTCDRVQKRFKGEELDPDQLTTAAVNESYPPSPAGRRVFLSLLRIALAAVAVWLGVKDIEGTALDPYVLGAGLVVGGIAAAFIPTSPWRGPTRGAAAWLFVALGFMSAVTAAVLLIPNRPLSLVGSAGIAAFMLSHWSGVLASVPRPGDATGQLLEDLWRLQRWAAAELQRATPRLRDAWIPWLEALGLGPQVARWQERHGGQTAPTVAPDLADVGAGAALAGPPFTGRLAPAALPPDADWTDGFFVYPED